MRVFVKAALLTLTLLPLAACTTNGHWPPLTSQVIDAETGQPIDGAVVLAYWVRYTASFGGWGNQQFVDAEEAVTGPEGRYSIRSRLTYTIPAVTQVDGPEMVIFKPGYGHWQIRPSGDTELMALPHAKTRTERLSIVSEGRTDPGVVPPEYKRRLKEAIERERAYLGLK